MPTLPGSLSNPGALLALCLIVGLVVGVNATLFSMFRRRDNGPRPSSRVLSGAREKQQQQTDQMEALHRAVGALSPDPTKPVNPHE